MQAPMFSSDLTSWKPLPPKSSRGTRIRFGFNFTVLFYSIKISVFFIMNFVRTHKSEQQQASGNGLEYGEMSNVDRQQDRLVLQKRCCDSLEYGETSNVNPQQERLVVQRCGDGLEYGETSIRNKNGWSCRGAGRLSQYDRDDDRALFPKRTTSNSRVKLIVKDTIPNFQSFDRQQDRLVLQRCCDGLKYGETSMTPWVWGNIDRWTSIHVTTQSRRWEG